VYIPRWSNFSDGLDLERVDGDATLGNDEPKEAARGEAKYALEGVQADIVLTTPLKDDS
jgi:hypothetical protein